MSILARKDSIWTSNEPNTERRLCTDSSSITSAFVDNHRKLYLLTHLSVGFITRSITASLSNRQKNCSLPLEVIRIVFKYAWSVVYACIYIQALYVPFQDTAHPRYFLLGRFKPEHSL